MPFPHVVVASARVVWAAFSRYVCDCASVFLEGVAVRPEELNKFFRPLLTGSSGTDGERSRFRCIEGRYQS
jgi:hypothetical protein